MIKKYKRKKKDEENGIGPNSVLDDNKDKKYTITLDENMKVRISFEQNDYPKISKVHSIVLEINNLPIDDEDRRIYSKDIANIYKIAYQETEDIAIQYAHKLKEIIEKNLLICRKVQFMAPALLGFGIVVLITYLISFHYELYIVEPIIYGSLGGGIAVIINNKKFDVDYNVQSKYIYFEVIKLIVLSNTMAIVGKIAINAGVILSNIGLEENEYLLYLVFVLCGFSQTFVPSILNQFESDSTHSDK